MKKQENPIYQAQAILARRDHSEFEVRTKLTRKGFLPEQVDEGINWLKENNLLDDEKFARAYVQNILRSRSVGPAWLILKLREKRISQEHIEPAVFSELDPAREEELAREAMNSWLKKHSRKSADPEEEYKFRNKLQRYLVSRGFSFDIVMQVLD